MRLEELTPGNSLASIEPSAVVSVLAVVPIDPDVVQVIYKTPDGIPMEGKTLYSKVTILIKEFN